MRKPVRQLSLGERMKVEIVGSLLHRPQVLFLDEPTIGLDITMQKRIREFVAEYRQRHEATVMLTSHYMADVEALCERVIVIHHGRILFDGDLAALADTVAAWKTVAVALENGAGDLSAYGEVIHRDGDLVTLRVPKAETARVTARLLAEQEVLDLNVEDPPIEDVIELVFAQRGGAVSTAPAPLPQAGRIRSFVDFYLTAMRTQVSSQFQYRAATYMYLLGHGRRARHLPRRLDDDRRGLRRHGRWADDRRARRVLHRLDVRPQHESRLHAVRLGVADPRGELSGWLLRPLHPSTTTSRASRAGRCRG